MNENIKVEKTSERFANRAAIFIKLNNIASNFKSIKNNVSKDCNIMAVVKADAYGHGIVPVSKVLIENGADFLGVAIMEEALEIRESGIKEPVMILGFTSPRVMEKCVINDIILTVLDYENAKELSGICARVKKKCKVHVKIDSGMGRIGFLPSDDNLEVIKKIANLPFLEVEGIYTHLATSDMEDKSFSKIQFKRFITFCNRLESLGINFKYKHISNSGATVSLREFDLNIVRAGIIMYGLMPSKEVGNEKFELLPALSFKSFISFVKTVEVGETVGYGATFKTERKTVVATIPLGYADGYSRLLSNKGEVLINGKRARIIGNVCMDQFMVDATDMGEVLAGDEVVLIGKQGQDEITADELASWQSTISYEVMCDISKRVKRIYV